MSSHRTWRAALILVAAVSAVVLILYRFALGPQATHSAKSPTAAAALAALAQALPQLVVHPQPRPLPRDLVLAGPEGPVALADTGGQWLVVNFWATWCGPCVKELPALDRLQTALAGSGVKVVLVSLDSKKRSEVEATMKSFGVANLETLMDPELKAMPALQASSLPTTLIVDPQGREAARAVGAAEWDKPEIVAALRRLGGSSPG